MTGAFSYSNSKTSQVKLIISLLMHPLIHLHEQALWLKEWIGKGNLFIQKKKKKIHPKQFISLHIMQQHQFGSDIVKLL